MLDQLRSSFCCVNDDPQISINVELMNCKGFSKLNKQNSGSESNQQILNKFSPIKDFGPDFGDYSLYIMVEFNGGNIVKDTDFLYIKDELEPAPKLWEKLDPNAL